MEKLRLAYKLYENSLYFNHKEKINDKEIVEIYNKFNNRKELYLYILDLINDNDSSYSKRLKKSIYWEMGKDYYQELINAINDYIECIVDEDIINKQEREWSKGNMVSFNEAKELYTSFLYYELSCLEYKLKEYNKSLEYINTAIELSYLTDRLIKQKYKVLAKIDKQKAKDYLKELDNEYKDRKLGNFDGTKKEWVEYFRLLGIKSTIDELLKKCKI